MNDSKKRYLGLVDAMDSKMEHKPKVYRLPVLGLHAPHNRKMVWGEGVQRRDFGAGFHCGKHGLVHPDGTPCDASSPDKCPLFRHPRTEAAEERERNASIPRSEREHIEFDKVSTRPLQKDELEAVEPEFKPLIERYNALVDRMNKARYIISTAAGRLEYNSSREEKPVYEQAKKVARAFVEEHRSELQSIRADIEALAKDHRCRLSKIGMYDRMSIDCIRVPTGTTRVSRVARNITSYL